MFQRPQHLMTRFATERRVFFFEEPQFDAAHPHLRWRKDGDVFVVVPHLSNAVEPADRVRQLKTLLDETLTQWGIVDPIAWYYTPMALEFSRHIKAAAVVFDCMDELSAFAGAPPELLERERELLAKANVVFTGGQSLYEAKRWKHPRVHAFPSSVDVSHFGQARQPLADPADQAGIAHPRLGFFGVLDERLDLALVREVAGRRPDWQLVFLGPSAKIDSKSLPRASNIHYLGMKSYRELPFYLANWDLALLPFARNEATRYISPTKTPEYLAAGRRVVSTSIADVVRPYGELGLVEIADDPGSFITAAARLLSAGDDASFTTAVDQFLDGMSWNRTWEAMSRAIDEAVERSGSRQFLSGGPTAERAVPPGRNALPVSDAV